MSLSPRFLAIYLSAFLIFTLPDEPKAHGGLRKCIQRFSANFKSGNQKTADEILSQYKPFDSRSITLTPVTEHSGGSIFRGKDPLHPHQEFVLKVAPLFESFNDYYALKALKEVQKETKTQVRIIDSVLLTPKNDKTLSPYTKVLQKNPFIHGRPLVEILVDPTVPTALKYELRRKYSNWIDEVWAELLKRGYDVDKVKPEINFFRNHEELAAITPDFLKSQPPILQASRPWAKILPTTSGSKGLPPQLRSLGESGFNDLIDAQEDLLIILKSDNVFVDEAGELVLFDPL